MRHLFAPLVMCSLTITAASPAHADDAREAYVTSNLLGIFYHEVGHALIDVLGLPVFGQEEDAADTASILLIDTFFEEDSAQAIAEAAAFGFLDEAAAVEDVAWWDVHGPDEQRFYNLVCLFYGADTDARADLAAELELPQERAVSCEEEYDLAIDSWGPIFDEVAAGTHLHPMQFDSAGTSLTHDLIRDEVAALRADMTLPQPITVKVETCGEANAFYDPGALEVIICTEFEDHLRQIFDNQMH